MFELWRQISASPFLQNALIAGICISVCASLLGVNLVLKHYAMLGDGLAHVGFGAMAVAAACHAAPLTVAVPVVIAAAFFMLRIRQSSGVHADAAIAMLSAGALAAGVTAVSLSPGVNININNFMFGNILTVTRWDVIVCVILAAFALLLYVFFYHKIFASSFDEDFARATGTAVTLCNLLIAVLTAVTVVLGLRMMGALLISSLIVFPALSAMRIARRYLSVTLCAAALSMLGFLGGFTLSYDLRTPTGAGIVLTHALVFLLCFSARYLLSLRKPPAL